MDEFTSEDKKDVESKMLDALLTAAEGDVVTPQEMSEIARYILDTIDTIQSKTQLLEFLRTLSSKWNIFTPVLVTESGEIRGKKEKSALKEVLQLAKDNKIDEAINLAKSATQ